MNLHQIQILNWFGQAWTVNILLKICMFVIGSEYTEQELILAEGKSDENGF